MPLRVSLSLFLNASGWCNVYACVLLQELAPQVAGLEAAARLASTLEKVESKLHNVDFDDMPAVTEYFKHSGADTVALLAQLAAMQAIDQEGSHSASLAALRAMAQKVIGELKAYGLQACDKIVKDVVSRLEPVAGGAEEKRKWKEGLTRQATWRACVTRAADLIKVEGYGEKLQAMFKDALKDYEFVKCLVAAVIVIGVNVRMSSDWSDDRQSL